MTAPQRVTPLAPFEESPIRKLLIQRMESAERDEVISYADLSAVAGCDVQHEGRHLLASAMKALLKKRVAFGTVINVGVKRLSDIGIVDRVAHESVRIHRAAKRTAKVLTVANYEKLPPEDQQRYRIEQLRIGAIAQFGGKASESRLLRAVHESVTPKQLRSAITKSLEQF